MFVDVLLGSGLIKHAVAGKKSFVHSMNIKHLTSARQNRNALVRFYTAAVRVAINSRNLALPRYSMMA